MTEEKAAAPLVGLVFLVGYMLGRRDGRVYGRIVGRLEGIRLLDDVQRGRA